jgi:hypothetical protein
MALCSNCGHDKGEGSYCGGCGQRSGSAAPPPQFQQPQYQQPFQQPQYQQQYGVPQFIPVSNKTNSLAIASLVVSLLCCAPLGVIFGHMALSQINRTGEGGRGLAVAGLVIGYVGCGLALFVFMGASAGSGY